MDDLAAFVHGARFTPVRLAPGYEMGAVDAALDAVVDSLRSGADPSSIAHLCATASFPQARLREGYAMDEVDDLLDRVASTVAGPRARARSRDRRPVTHQDNPVHRPPDGAGVVSEQRGWLDRWRDRRRS